MKAESHYHLQDTAGSAWSIGATLVGAIVIGVALVIVGVQRMRTWFQQNF